MIKQLLQRLTDTSNGGRRLPWITRKVMAWISGFDADKYWRRQYAVANPNSKVNPLLIAYYLLWIKHVDNKHNCSFGTTFNRGMKFITPPNLPHGLNGIIVGRDARIGRGCTIYHQVTIAGGGVVIGDYVELGAGAKVLPHVKIGNHVHVGANCVVVEDIPDYATVVLQKPRIINKNIDGSESKAIEL